MKKRKKGGRFRPQQSKMSVSVINARVRRCLLSQSPHHTDDKLTSVDKAVLYGTNEYRCFRVMTNKIIHSWLRQLILPIFSSIRPLVLAPRGVEVGFPIDFPNDSYNQLSGSSWMCCSWFRTWRAPSHCCKGKGKGSPITSNGNGRLLHPLMCVPFSGFPASNS